MYFLSSPKSYTTTRFDFMHDEDIIVTASVHALHFLKGDMPRP